MYGRLLLCKLHVAEVLSIVFLLRFCREEDVGPFDSFAVCIGDTAKYGQCISRCRYRLLYWGMLDSFKHQTWISIGGWDFLRWMLHMCWMVSIELESFVNVDTMPEKLAWWEGLLWAEDQIFERESSEAGGGGHLWFFRWHDCVFPCVSTLFTMNNMVFWNRYAPK